MPAIEANAVVGLWLVDDVLEGNDDFVRKGVGREPNQLGYAK